MSSLCTKYRRLKMLAEDGRATRRQLNFVQKHESSCDQCQTTQALATEALAAFRSATIEPVADPSFESRVIRRVRAERDAKTVSYWMPALAGAVVAGAALLAILQILMTSPVTDSINMQGQEARLDADGGLDIPQYSETPVVIDPTE